MLYKTLITSSETDPIVTRARMRHVQRSDAPESGVAIDRRTFLRSSIALGGALLIPGAFGGASSSSVASAADEDIGLLGGFVRDRMRAARVPGLAVCLIKHSRILGAEGFGAAHIADRRVVTAETIFMLASVSKTVTATSLMQLYDAGRFALDDDIDGFLPFSVRNPNAPDVPITFRQLLTHTSSLADNWDVLNRYYVLGDSPIPLGAFVRDYFVPGGTNYDPYRNFAPYAPGQAWSYCNMAVALAGHLVETIGGTQFDVSCTNTIFDPLGMTDTSWRLADLDVTTVAMPYGYDGGTMRYEPYGQYGYPDYPDGLLRTSVVHLARHLIAFIDDGVYEGTRILEASTVTEMRRVQFPDLDPVQGLIWYYDSRNGDTLLGHNGGDWGVATQMFYRPADGAGVILLANGDGIPIEPLLEIQDLLFDIADRIAAPADLAQITVPSEFRDRRASSTVRRTHRVGTTPHLR
jgi:CubicO group peptidase (beta-lactamase class C family)